MTDIVKFNFYGDELECVKDDEDLWVSVRRMCEPLGIDHDNQRVKLKKKSWARTVLITAHDANNRKQSQFFIHVDSVPMWLATIDEKRVSEHVQLKLIKFQLEAAKALRDHFFDHKISIPDNLEDALLLAASLEGERKKLKARVEADRPKVEFAKRIETSEQTYSLSAASKVLNNEGIGFGRQQLCNFLRYMGHLFRNSRKELEPMQDCIDRGYFEYKFGERYEFKNNVKTGRKLRYGATTVTGKGLVWIKSLMERYPDLVDSVLNQSAIIHKSAHKNRECRRASIHSVRKKR
ncbi:MAG: hypothetical protein GY841_15535 [FCB group bacterium]|nr:hypothetical protein [FCB group bacterium]